MAGKIFRNGVAYGGGGSAVPDAVLQIKVGDERYDPVNGVVTLPENIKVYTFTLNSSSWDSTTKEYELDISSVHLNGYYYNKLDLDFDKLQYWRELGIQVEYVNYSVLDDIYEVTGITFKCDTMPDNDLTFNIYSTPTSDGTMKGLVYPDINFGVEIDKLNKKVPDCEIYTFRINMEDSNPATCCKPFRHGYGCDNYNYRSAKMDFTNDTFDYGDWANAFFIRNLKPCYLNKNGTIAYELNKNNYKQKADGTTASEVTDLTSSGNVMVGFPTVYYYRYTSGKYYYCVISNRKLDYRFEAFAHHDKDGNILPYIYLAAYNGALSDYDSEVGTSTGKLRSISGVAVENNASATTNNTIIRGKSPSEYVTYASRNNNANEEGEGWYVLHKVDYDMINDLLLLIGMNTNGQATFGTGKVTGYSTPNSPNMIDSGTLDNKGLFYGTNDSTTGVKVFGIENWWGNMSKYVAGWIYYRASDGSSYQSVKMTYNTEDGSASANYSIIGTGYAQIPNSAISGTDDGGIDSYAISNYAFVPLTTNGTETTYLCDSVSQNANRKGIIAVSVGGSTNSDTKAGPFFISITTLAVSSLPVTVGATLTYKPLAA